MAVVRKGFSLFIILMPFLIRSIFIIPNIFHEHMNLGANFISKMSKLFGEVGRVDNKSFFVTMVVTRVEVAL